MCLSFIEVLYCHLYCLLIVNILFIYLCFSRLTVNYIISEEDSHEGAKKEGHIDENLIIKYFPTMNENLTNECAVCICGPPGFNTFCEK